MTFNFNLYFTYKFITKGKIDLYFCNEHTIIEQINDKFEKKSLKRFDVNKNNCTFATAIEKSTAFRGVAQSG